MDPAGDGGPVSGPYGAIQTTNGQQVFEWGGNWLTVKEAAACANLDLGLLPVAHHRDALADTEEVAEAGATGKADRTPPEVPGPPELPEWIASSARRWLRA